uniref:CD80-like immunoglobulin C2-set domain-containing protein n=1 Tax=Anopheles melas TaxID=34690 RepID=A0A182TG98_9DIPT
MKGMEKIIGLKLKTVRIPPYKFRGELALLECHYELNGQRKGHSSLESGNRRHHGYQNDYLGERYEEEEKLYSIKWYKDNEEFYRYVPSASQPIKSYKIEGIRVDPNHSDVVPKDGPHISDGGRQSFQNGETMELNCTSGRSYPATTLQWYLNDLLVTDPNNIIQYPEVQNQHGLITTFLGLSMVVNHRHYIDGTIRIKCVANLSPVLWRGGQESIVQWEQPPIDNRVAMLLAVKWK